MAGQDQGDKGVPLDSPATDKELCLWQAISTASGRPEDAAAAALETVSYAQMLVLFAPQAVPATAHLPLLLDTLPSRQPKLRRQGIFALLT